VKEITPEIEALLASVEDPAVRDALRQQLGAHTRAEAEGPAAQAEYLVTYSGKMPAGEVILRTPALPFQRSRAFGALDDFAWHNLLIHGDNQPVLRRLLAMRKEGLLKNADGSDGVRLVYIDPPFASEDDYETKQGKIAYSDKVAGAEFIEGLRRRLVLIRELLADNGSVFVHLDWRKSHYIKAILDEVFGEHNFVNEIIRCFYGGGQSKKFFPRKHDVVFWYSRTLDGYFSDIDRIRVPYDSAYKATVFASADTRAPGRTYGPNERGKIPEDWWVINRPYGDEITDYPTQKPEALLNRILTAASNEGDLVLDCFVGSGTTLAVAEKLNRRWIGVDLGLSAIYTSQKRLLNIASSPSLTKTKTKLKKQKPCCGDKNCEHCKEFCCAPKEIVEAVPHREGPRPFGIYTSGHYDFHRLKALPFGDYRTFVLRLFGATEHIETINGIQMDGRHRGDPVMVFDFNLDPDAQITIESFEEIGAFLEGRVRGRVLYIAPSASLALYDDRVTTHGVDFEIRRVPYSVVAALQERANQVTSAADINRIIETVGFDFGAPPEVVTELDPVARTLTIKGFHSRAIVRDLTEDKRGFESLAMVLIDYRHDGVVFDLDDVQFAEELAGRGWMIELTEARSGATVAVSVCDLFGNEHIEVLRDQAWGPK
jgi:site-specific DNA-methyltransferase (adenine-specific)/adenine-specific DNA-methyltransferase